MTQNPTTQYATDANLVKRQRLWTESRRDPDFDLFRWVLDLAEIREGDTRAVLDVGCGNGVYERLLHAQGHVGARVSVDLSAGMLALVTDSTRVNGERNFAEFKHLMEQAVGTDWKMWRPVDEYFSLESGTEQLRTAFESVTRVNCPASDVVVTDLDAFTDYVDSIADHYEAEVGVPWVDVVRRARTLATEAMEPCGELRLTASVGAFVCR